MSCQNLRRSYREQIFLVEYWVHTINLERSGFREYYTFTFTYPVVGALL